MPRVLNRYTDEIPEDAIYVGRPTPFGNPCKVGTHQQRVDLHRAWIMRPEQKGLRELVRRRLGGRDLICFCAPDSCHADVLLEIANDPDPELRETVLEMERSAYPPQPIVIGSSDASESYPY